MALPSSRQKSPW